MVSKNEHMERLESKIDDLTFKVDLVYSEQVAQKQELVGIREHLADHDRKFEIITSQFGSVSGRVDGLTGRFDGLSDRVDGLTGRFDGLSDRVDGLTGRVDGLSDRVDGLSGRVDKLTGRVDTIDSKVEDLTTNVRGLGVLLEQVAHNVELVAEGLEGNTQLLRANLADHEIRIAALERR